MICIDNTIFFSRNAFVDTPGNVGEKKILTCSFQKVLGCRC